MSWNRLNNNNDDKEWKQIDITNDCMDQALTK